MRVVTWLCWMARVYVIGSANGRGCQAAPSSPLATSGGGQLSGRVSKAEEQLARGCGRWERRAVRSRVHLNHASIGVCRGQVRGERAAGVGAAQEAPQALERRSG